MNKIPKAWMDKYELAKKYYEHYENLNIPESFKTTNGIDYDPDGILLGVWIHTQRRIYKGTVIGKHTSKQVEMLDNIGMIWDLFDYNWKQMYELAKKYYEHYGDLNIPYDFKTINGIDYDECGFQLGSWIQTQRQLYKGNYKGKNISEKIIKLDKIEMIWDLVDYNWNQMYELARKYYEHYGDLNILQNFKTINGIDYDSDGFQLGKWIETQRQAYKGRSNGKITPKQIQILDNIEMIWYTSERREEKSQEEIIDKSNSIRKQKEIQNRFYTFINQYNGSDLPDKEIMNEGFINQLNYKSLRLEKK